MSDDDTPGGETPTPTGASGLPPTQRVPRPARLTRERLDVLLVRQGLAPSRERARALIMAGEVRVDGRAIAKAGTLVAESARCELVGPAAELRFVSRGGLKLERALDVFGLEVRNRICFDVGASTGGFTDVLLRRGAARVYALDVGHGQLAWSLRTDPRVVVMERTNIRHIEALPEAPSCAVIDVSFISLRLVLPQVAALIVPGSWVVALVKPQFEAGRGEADRGGGVISDPEVHRRVLAELLAWIAGWRDGTRGLCLAACGLIPSPITGREGNHEYLLELLVCGEHVAEEATVPVAHVSHPVEAVVAAAFGLGA